MQRKNRKEEDGGERRCPCGNDSPAPSSQFNSEINIDYTLKSLKRKPNSRLNSKIL